MILWWSLVLRHVPSRLLHSRFSRYYNTFWIYIYMDVYICLSSRPFCGRFSHLTDMVGGQNGLYPSSGLTSPPRSPGKLMCGIQRQWVPKPMFFSQGPFWFHIMAVFPLLGIKQSFLVYGPWMKRCFLFKRREYPPAMLHPHTYRYTTSFPVFFTWSPWLVLRSQVSHPNGIQAFRSHQKHRKCQRCASRDEKKNIAWLEIHPFIWIGSRWYQIWLMFNW